MVADAGIHFAYCAGVRAHIARASGAMTIVSAVSDIVGPLMPESAGLIGASPCANVVP
jgi:hypothetical protein